MAFQASKAKFPARKGSPEDPRFLDVFVPHSADADLLLAGVPYDGAVIGRKGAKDGPTAIREAFRYLGGHDAAGTSLRGLRIHDLGDAPVATTTTRTHHLVEGLLAAALQPAKPLIVLGGDNSLSFATFRALHATYGGRWGIVVLDAHYDLRPHEGEPTSGTPYRRILEEIPGDPVRGRNLAEVGIRPYANAPSLADYAKQNGVTVITAPEVHAKGIAAATRKALAAAGNGVDHLFLSVDIDGLDQSIAPGCSAPGAGGLTFHEAVHLVEAVAKDPRCRGMDVVEVAPNLDATGNTARVAAQLVAHFAGAVHGRPGKPGRRARRDR